MGAESVVGVGVRAKGVRILGRQVWGWKITGEEGVGVRRGSRVRVSWLSVEDHGGGRCGGVERVCVMAEGGRLWGWMFKGAGALLLTCNFRRVSFRMQ